jgi:hypothetical protein
MIIYIELSINKVAVEPAQFCGEFALQAIVKVEKLSRQSSPQREWAISFAPTGWRE